MCKKLTTEEFIKKAVEIHGDKYDYSNVHYVNAKTKVKIICTIHGEFLQEPSNHLQGQGCKACRYDPACQDLAQRLAEDDDLPKEDKNFNRRAHCFRGKVRCKYYNNWMRDFRCACETGFVPEEKQEKSYKLYDNMLGGTEYTTGGNY